MRMTHDEPKLYAHIKKSKESSNLISIWLLNKLEIFYSVFFRAVCIWPERKSSWYIH